LVPDEGQALREADRFAAADMTDEKEVVAEGRADDRSRHHDGGGRLGRRDALHAVDGNRMNQLEGRGTDRANGNGRQQSVLNRGDLLPYFSHGFSRGIERPGLPVESLSDFLVYPTPAWKRALDIVGALALLIVTSPLMAFAALAIKFTSPGPVLFKQRRAGLGGRPFTIYKFRTMIRGASSQGAGLAVNEGDERILRFGDAYRRLGLDELPQLWNVLRGEMSLIGPRPTLLEQVERYSPCQRLRLKMRPGVTGWSQIHGRTSIPWSRRIELDVWYVEHWSLRLDARILWRTLGQMTRPSETYKGSTGGWDL
jgi:lipopolysaccharide/colanic/teichoic acid biosynthesis glycosyltransferase